MSGGAKEQVGRLLALVPLIQRRGAMPVDEAAAALGVPPSSWSRTSGCSSTAAGRAGCPET